MITKGTLKDDLQYAIFDIDGTLSVIGERGIFAVAGLWDDFNKRCSHDKPNRVIVDLCNAWAAVKENGIIVLTGRSDKWLKETSYWLRLRNVKYNCLIMRPEGNTDSDFEFKKDVLDYLRGEDVNVVLAFDDRESCLNMWKEEGVTCFKVGESIY